MKLLAISLLLCALMALNRAADAAESEPQPGSELQEAKAENAAVEKRIFCWLWHHLHKKKHRPQRPQRPRPQRPQRPRPRPPQRPRPQQPQRPRPCPPRRPSLTRIGHRYFFYIRHRLTWNQAERNCRRLGGHLASVHSAWEYRQIRILIARHDRRHPQAWIGGNDIRCEGHWKWSDGSCFNYKGWCCGEPNNANNQDCLQINYSSRKCWDDLQCNNRLPSVCVRKRRW